MPTHTANRGTVLITGVLGQDGSYMADRALREGYAVVGAVRGEIRPDRLWRLRHLGIEDRVRFVPLDLLNPDSIERALDDAAPDIVFNFAAQSSVGESFNTPLLTAEAGAMGAIRIFEKARFAKKKMKVFQASSSEIFGDITDSHHSEESFFNPKTPYGATKLFAHIMAEAYRASYGAHVSTGILFNHESPLRGENFVTRKITRSLVRIKLGLQDRLFLGNLDARRDWSHACDFVAAIWQLMSMDQPENIVLASGTLTSVRHFVDLAGHALGFDIAWEGHGVAEVGVDTRSGRSIVAVDPAFYRPYDPAQPLADISKARRLLGWAPAASLDQLVEEMVGFDLLQAQTLGKA